MGISLESVADGNNVDHFICSICTLLLEDALVLKTCEHIFCRLCITKWIETQKFSIRLETRVAVPGDPVLSCPDCRQAFTEKECQKPMRLVQTMLGAIKLKCTNVGCTDVIGYDDFQKHMRKCIKAEINCASCDIPVLRTNMDDHKKLCVKYLAGQILKLKMELKTVKEQHVSEIGTIKQQHVTEINVIKKRHERVIKQYKDTTAKAKSTVKDTKPILNTTPQTKETKPNTKDNSKSKSPKLVVKKSPGQGSSSELLTLTRTFVCNIEESAENGISSEGFVFHMVCSEYVKVDGGKVAIRFEKHRQNTSINSPIVKYMVHITLIKDVDVEKIDVEWVTVVGWATTNKKNATKINTSSTAVSNSFLLPIDSQGSVLTPMPSKKSEINVTVEIKSWIVKRIDQLIDLS